MTDEPKSKDFAILLMSCFFLAVPFPASTVIQGPGATVPQQLEFARMAEKLAAERLAGGEDDPVLQGKSLAALDAIVLAGFNAAGEPALDTLNQRLAGLVTRAPGTGESFRLLKLAGRQAAYVLTANFSLAGPSAVRVYAGAPGHFALAAQIDRSTYKDFFDEYLEVVPIAGPAEVAVTLFVTIAGRADDLQTGEFTAWSFDGTRLKPLWSSDLVQESKYEAGPDGFKLTYCAQTDEENPRICRRMTRDRYTWDGAEWKRAEQTAVPVPKR